MQAQKQTSKIKDLLDSSNEFYNSLLGYKPEQTSLQQIKELDWNPFTIKRGLNPNSSGIYFPRNQTALIRNSNSLSLFHEYFGHGLYCEQNLSGIKLVDLEKKLLEEEKQEFSNSKFTLEDVQKFRKQNKTFNQLVEFRKDNLLKYETFAIWTEYLLSKENNLKDLFSRKYDSLYPQGKEVMDSLIRFNEENGNLATFYTQGMARVTTPKRVKILMEDLFPNELKKSKLVLLTGSKKPFSDIDLFTSSNSLPEIKENWIDMVVFNEEDFERRVNLFEVQVTHPIIQGELVYGDIDYLEQKKKQLQEQPITPEAIAHNFKKYEEQEKFSLENKFSEKQRNIHDSYASTYLASAVSLKEGKRLFTKEELESYSLSEKNIKLKGGINI